MTVLKRIDELGRIVLPAQMRKRLGVSTRSELSLSFDGDRIALSKACVSCRLCGKDTDVRADILLCQDCIERIKRL